MTDAQVYDTWREFVLPAVQAQYEQDRIPDYPARSESFNNYTDGLCKDGQITDEQYNEILHPSECIAPWEN